jgi:hypothetical protein
LCGIFARARNSAALTVLGMALLPFMRG